VEHCYQQHQSIGQASRPQPCVATLHEHRDAVSELDIDDELPANVSAKAVKMAVYVNNQCVTPSFGHPLPTPVFLHSWNLIMAIVQQRPMLLHASPSFMLLCRYVSETAAQCIFDASRDIALQSSISIQEKFHVLISLWPQSVTVRIYEVSSRSSALALRARTLLAEIPVAVPGAQGASVADTLPQGYDWACPTQASFPAGWDSSDAGGVPGDESQQAIFPEGAPDAIFA
jgi:CC2D2A N-terminal C2 domain